MAEYCCSASIELEPKTLTPCQLTQAREVAIDIVQNNEPKEATSTFVEGVRPVTSVKETTGVILEKIETLSTEDGGMNKDINCQCWCNFESQDVPKGPLSAPF